MKITDQDVMRTANLARLRFTPDERVELASQLNRIFQYFESLAEVETEGIESIQTPTNALRSDDVQQCLPLPAVFNNAPSREKNFFKVPKIIEG
jgi:aspartyl-tRNA(Asn)/glutamyl-tRNA(Gln) amidotransferase subunit C